jgi:hypothetical protein
MTDDVLNFLLRLFQKINRSTEQSLGVRGDGSQATYTHLHNRIMGSKDGQHFSVLSCKGT